MSCRGNDGELRLGIRRAVQLKNGTPAGALYSHGSNHGLLEAISGAISAKREFQIYYNPRCTDFLFFFFFFYCCLYFAWDINVCSIVEFLFFCESY